MERRTRSQYFLGALSPSECTATRFQFVLGFSIFSPMPANLVSQAIGELLDPASLVVSYVVDGLAVLPV